MQYIITSSSPIWVKDSANLNSRNVSTLQPNTIVDVIDISNGWYKYADGWFYGYDSNGNSIVGTPGESSGSTSATVSAASLLSEEGSSTTLRASLAAKSTDPTRNDDGTLKPGTYIDKDGNKTTIEKLNDGGYRITKVTERGKQIDEYTYDNSENLISSKYSSSQANGFRNVTTRDTQGNSTEVVYTEDPNTGGIIKTTTTYDADRNVLSQNQESNKRRSNDYNGAMGADLGAKSSSFSVDASSSSSKAGSEIATLRVGDIFGIHGMPYQYMDYVDRRLDNSAGSFGRMYADRVVAKMPLLIMTAGEPEFLAGWNSKDKENFLEDIVKNMSSDSDLSNIIKREGRYYSFKSRADLYYKYVAPLQMQGAYYLGLSSEVLPWSGGESLGTYTWSNFYNKSIHGKLNYRNSIPFYIHSDTQISDSFGNSTTKSMLDGKINGYSDMAREIQFLTGTMGAQLGVKVDGAIGAGGSDNVAKNQENAQRLAADILGSGNFIKSLTSNLTTVLEGGKLMFPEIWSDSSFMKSYNVTVKLRTPDADPLSWYLNIYTPICHLLPFVMPKQSGPNGYIAPFLCSGFYKGQYNCRMGIVTDMTVARGDMGNWTLGGLPCAVDISFTIKDLYDALGVSSITDSNYGIMNNIALLDYMANLCGVNINEPDITRMIKMYYAFKVGGRFNSFVDLSVEKALDQWGQNVLMGAYRGRI